MSKEVFDLSELNEALSIHDKHGEEDSSNLEFEVNQDFKRTLVQSPFNIFTIIADLGFYGWTPPPMGKGGETYKDIKLVGAEELQIGIDVECMPKTVISVSKINRKCPIPFRSMPAREHWNKYPYDQSYATPLHVAAGRIKSNGLKEIDFMFGGSTLNMLATQDTGDSTYLITTFPGTEIALIAKYSEYLMDSSAFGFQFERLVTGGRFEDKDDHPTVDHMQLMVVGNRNKFKVLFSAECDGIDSKGNPVEVKSSNPRYWGCKTMFQMISSGSTSLYSGFKSRGSLMSVKNMNLSQVISTALQYEEVKTLEDKIISAMENFKKEVESGKFSDGSMWKIGFKGRGLTLTKFSANQEKILPKNDVISALINNE